MIDVIVTDEPEEPQYWVSHDPEGEGYLPINREPQPEDEAAIRGLFDPVIKPLASSGTTYETRPIRWHREIIVRVAAKDGRSIREYTI